MSDVDLKFAHCLNSVLGWLELGNPREARAELQALPEQYGDDLDVLDIRWLLHARECDWEGALKIAERILEVNPESATGWLHRAYAVRRIPNGGLKEAAELLRPAFEMFQTEPTIPFNLACYACQLGELDEARHWLTAAFNRGDRKIVKATALDDVDLKTLWPEIRCW
jgi:Flp pilus assembly protein TadD